MTPWALAAVPAIALLVADPELPLPPTPPTDAPVSTEAPVPNRDLAAPPDRGGAGPTLVPTLDARPPVLPGGDPVPGTQYRSDLQQRRQFIPKPGIRLVVPLDK